MDWGAESGQNARFDKMNRSLVQVIAPELRLDRDHHFCIAMANNLVLSNLERKQQSRVSSSAWFLWKMITWINTRFPTLPRATNNTAAACGKAQHLLPKSHPHFWALYLFIMSLAKLTSISTKTLSLILERQRLQTLPSFSSSSETSAPRTNTLHLPQITRNLGQLKSGILALEAREGRSEAVGLLRNQYDRMRGMLGEDANIERYE